MEVTTYRKQGSLKSRLFRQMIYGVAPLRKLLDRVEELEEYRKKQERDYSPWLFSRPMANLLETVGISDSVTSIGDDDIELLQRIIKAYRLTSDHPSFSDGSLWQGLESGNIEIHKALLSGDVSKLVEVFRDPQQTCLFLGFDGMNSHDSKSYGASWPDWNCTLTFDSLCRLAEALGVVRIGLPPAWQSGLREIEKYSADDLISKIEKVFGFEVKFPNPFVGELGTHTTRGIASFRAVQSLFHAWRIKELVRTSSSPSVLEIGAGMGRTAYYSHEFGISDYTIVDLPLTCVAQAFFLGKVLGSNAIELYGEENSKAVVRIIPPKAYLEGSDHFDLAVNVDSMTEMPRAVADEYMLSISKRAKKFLSINHEANDFTVKQIFDEILPGVPFWRAPFHLRAGYAEEVISF